MCRPGGACRSDTSTPRFDAVSTRRAATSRGHDTWVRRVGATRRRHFQPTCRNVAPTRPPCSVAASQNSTRADSGSPHPTRRVGRRGATRSTHPTRSTFEWIGFASAEARAAGGSRRKLFALLFLANGHEAVRVHTAAAAARGAARQGAPRRHDVAAERYGRGAAGGRREMENRAERWWKGGGLP